MPNCALLPKHFHIFHIFHTSGIIHNSAPVVNTGAEKRVSRLQAIFAFQAGQDLTGSVLNECIHFRFCQIGIFPVKMVIFLPVECSDIHPSVIKSIGTENIQKGILEPHGVFVYDVGTKAGMLFQIKEVQVIPVLLCFLNQCVFVCCPFLRKAVLERSSYLRRPELIRKQVNQVAQEKRIFFFRIFCPLFL